MAAKPSAVQRRARRAARRSRGVPTNLTQEAPTETVVDGQAIQRNPDGSIVIMEALPEPEARIPVAGDHDENLVEQFDDGELKQLAERLIEYYEIDKESRREWEDLEKRGVALVGVNQIKADDKNASLVNSPGKGQVKMPLLSEAIVNFQSRSITEVFPATGPVKCTTFGISKPELEQQRTRVEDFANYYLTVEDQGYFADTDQMLTYLPISGSVLRKASQHTATGMPILRYVKATEFVINYAATNLHDAERYAHNYPVSGLDVRRAVQSGMWAHQELQAEKTFNDDKRRTADSSDGRSLSLHDDDQLFDIIEYHIDLDLEQDAKALSKSGEGMEAQTMVETRPYIVVVERTNRAILMIRRNWDEADAKCKKIVWFAHHKFFPGLGFYGWGYPHLLGSLAKGVNDAVNSQLDAAYAANFRGGYITQEGKAVGVNGVELEHGVYKALEGTYDEINKAIFSPDFKGPSPGMSELVVGMVEQFRRFANITESAVGDADNTGPVGTTIALIEQSNVVPTAIHKRLHVSMGEEFRMWAKLTFMYMPPEYPYEMAGEEKTALKKDFDGRVDIVPVSDPNISSQTQRIAMNQGTLELQAQRPDIYPVETVIEAHRRMLIAMKVPDIEAVAPRIEKPKYLDPISESQRLMSGQGVQAFETQDHAAHLAVHQHAKAQLMNSEQFGSWDPKKQQAVTGAFEAHEADHMGLLFRAQIAQQTGIPLPPPGEELPPDIEAEITAAIAQRLPPPPPLPKAEGTENGAEAADAKRALTQAAIEAKHKEAEAKIERDTSAWEAEQARMQVEHEAEMQRMQDKHQAEIAALTQKTAASTHLAVSAGEKKLQQQDKLVGQKLQHNEKATAQKLEHDKKSAGLKLQAGALGAKQKLKVGSLTAQQKLKTGDLTTKQKLEQGDATHKQQLKHADKATGQKLEHNDAAHQQAVAHMEQDAAMSKQHKEGEHKQGIRHKASEHAQQTRHSEDSHQREARQADESHKQQLEQTKKSGSVQLKQTEQKGKLQIQQARQAAKAKKQAAAKKKAKKSASK